MNKKLYKLILFLIPVNLGLHFVLNEAYVNGLLVDYLIPTVYLQDLLILGFLALNFKRISLKPYRENKFIIWFLFSVFLSTLLSQFFLSSFFAFLRTLLYVLFFSSTKGLVEKSEIYKILAFSVFFISILALAQWVHQGSIFDNYLFFGEQPYSVSTPGISTETINGKLKVPPYSTFRHPNVLGGFLSMVLVWIYAIKDRQQYFKYIFMLGLLTLVLTFSKNSWMVFILGFVFVYFKSLHHKHFLYLFFPVLLLFFSIPFFEDTFFVKSQPSLYRRSLLLSEGYSRLNSDYWLFGEGYNVSTLFIPAVDLGFNQPIHNIFVLLLVEAGVFSLIFLILFMVSRIGKALFLNHRLVFISLIQFILLGSFDHYFFTSHQMHLLMFLILYLP